MCTGLLSPVITPMPTGSVKVLRAVSWSSNPQKVGRDVTDATTLPHTECVASVRSSANLIRILLPTVCWKGAELLLLLLLLLW